MIWFMSSLVVHLASTECFLYLKWLTLQWWCTREFVTQGTLWNKQEHDSTRVNEILIGADQSDCKNSVSLVKTYNYNVSKRQFCMFEIRKIKILFVLFLLAGAVLMMKRLHHKKNAGCKPNDPKFNCNCVLCARVVVCWRKSIPS